MTGPGIGVPDYKSHDFLSYLQKDPQHQELKLSDQAAIFSLEQFRKKPEKLIKLAKAFLVPDASGNRSTVHPTLSHHFVKALHDSGILKSYLTMNIDNLEEGILPSDKVTHVLGAVNL